MSHQELAAAMVLVGEGHHVRSVAERRGARTPDFVACGTSVEVKSFMSLEARGGNPPSPQSVANKLLKAAEQGSVALIWGQGSGLDRKTAKVGFELFCDQATAKQGFGKLRAVRFCGDGLAFSLQTPADLVRASQRQRPKLSP